MDDNKKYSLDNYYKSLIHNDPNNEYTNDFIERMSQHRSEAESTLNDYAKLRELLKDKPDLIDAAKGYSWDTGHDWEKGGVPNYGDPADPNTAVKYKNATGQIQAAPEIGHLINKLKSHVMFNDYLPGSKTEFPKDADETFSEYPIRKDDIEYAKMIKDQRNMRNDYNIPDTLSRLNSLGHDETIENQSAKENIERFKNLFKSPIK